MRDRELIAHPGKPHASRGAITNYHNLTLVATQDIAPGMELFMDFGESWDGNFENDVFYGDHVL